jgi:hypothetical protein
MHARPRIAQTIVLAAAQWSCFAAIASAQQYRTDPVDERANNKFLIQQCVGDPAKYTAEKQKFDEFFNNYFFPALTRNDPIGLDQMGKLRGDFFKVYLWGTTNPTLQKDLTEMAFARLGNIVVSRDNPPYDPRVRYNAVLMLGLLDSQYANQGPGGAAIPAKPRATKELAQIVDSATTNRSFPAPLILGALIGLERHAQLRQSLSAESIGSVTSAALKIVTRDKPLPETDDETYAWMRIRAASVLALLGNVGTDNQVYNALLQLVVSLSSLDDRCEAAELLSKLTLEGAKVDGAATATQLLKLAVAVSEAELAKALEFEEKQFSGGMSSRTGRMDPSSGRSGTRGSGFGMDPKDLYPRRPLVAHLLGLGKAMTKTKPLVPADAQAKFTEILAAINLVIQKATDKDTIEPDVAFEVKQMAAAITRIAATTAPAARMEADAPK